MIEEKGNQNPNDAGPDGADPNAGGNPRPGSWFDGLPEDLKGNAAAANFRDKTPEDVVKSYLALDERIKGAIEVPGTDSSDEAKSEFALRVRKALGVPETSEGYNLNLPDGVQADDPMVSAFIEEAHKSGYTSEQAQAAIDTVSRVAREMAQAARADGKKALEEHWGPRFREHLDLAHTGIRGLAADAGVSEEEVGRLLDETKMGNYPYLVRMFAIAGERYREDRLKGGGSAGGEADLIRRLYPSMA